MNDRRRFVRFNALVISCFLLGSSITSAGEADKQLGDCGTAALYALVRVEGRSATFDAVAAQLGQLRPSGHSMKELREAARSFGLRLDGVFIGKKAELIDRPILAFLKVDRKGHFLVVRPVGHTGKLVQVIDSNQQTRVMEKSDLVASDQWTGLVLAPRRTDWSLALTIAILAPACLGGLVVALIRQKRSKNTLLHASSSQILHRSVQKTF